MTLALDYDGDGKRDLINSVAGYAGFHCQLLLEAGLARGEPWLQEVRVPAICDGKRRTRDQSSAVSVGPVGRHVRSITMRCRKMICRRPYLLPMGHTGPAFLAYQNFRIYLRWNQALV